MLYQVIALKEINYGDHKHRICLLSLENIPCNQLFNAFIVNILLPPSRNYFFFSYSIDAKCISQCVDSLRRATCDFTLEDMIHVYEILICLLIESSSISSCLMDDFRLAHCYVHMKDIILR
jgi:hypothetical protein